MEYSDCKYTCSNSEREAKIKCMAFEYNKKIQKCILWKAIDVEAIHMDDAVGLYCTVTSMDTNINQYGSTVPPDFDTLRVAKSKVEIEIFRGQYDPFVGYNTE